MDIGWWINHTVKWNLTLTADMYISISVCKMLNSNEKDRYVWNKSIQLSQIPLSMFLCTVTVAFLSFVLISCWSTYNYLMFFLYTRKMFFFSDNLQDSSLVKTAECICLILWCGFLLKKPYKPTNKKKAYISKSLVMVELLMWSTSSEMNGRLMTRDVFSNPQIIPAIT